jgi:predicted esterase
MTLVIAHIDKHRSNEQLTVTFSDMNCNVISSEKINIRPEISLKKEEFKINMGSLKSDRYSLTVQSSKDTILDEPVVILPKIDFQKITQKIQENKGQIKSGTANTLQFELNQISNKLTDLKIYETGEDILMDWKLFREKYELFNSGVDPYKNLTEPYRRAFKSKYDGTYQPYSIKLPVNYDPGKKYPLLVFLHGSGSDEQEQRLLNRSRSGGNFIEIAPLARDIYRAYAEDYSQKDIIEAIDDVAKYFAVDTDNIIIGGFSMGGYGALRTFYEHPNRYKGIAVHAGHPDLANEWLDGEHPNFLDDNYLTSFSNVPVFIYHGRKDAAINVDLIEKMSEKLTEAGTRVTKRIVEDKGHEYPDEKTNELYFDWLNQTIKN